VPVERYDLNLNIVGVSVSFPCGDEHLPSWLWRYSGRARGVFLLPVLGFVLVKHDLTPLNSMEVTEGLAFLSEVGAYRAPCCERDLIVSGLIEKRRDSDQDRARLDVLLIC
jgi:hypothetical protein